MQKKSIIRDICFIAISIALNLCITWLMLNLYVSQESLSNTIESQDDKQIEDVVEPPISFSYGESHSKYKSVSMVSLLSNPDLYDGEKVQFVAVCCFSPRGGDMLF